MGVYIPNMSKPKDCYLCEFTNGYECWSNGEPWFDVKEAYAKGTLSPNCPITEIDLVRCKDCKHYDTESRTFPCCTDIFGAVRYMEADGFCSKGERRADEN